METTSYGDSTSMLGIAKLDTPCGRCGWKYVGFHICFDKSKEVPGEGSLKNPGGTSRRTSRRTSVGSGAVSSPGRTEQLTEASNQRWDAYRAQTAPRDQKIVDRYKEGAGIRELAGEFHIAYQTATNVLKRAEAATGEKIIRPRGVTNLHRKRQEEVNDGLAS